MIKTTRWKPDTCGCQVDYTWNTDDSPDTRTHTCVAIVPCSVHVGIPNLADKFNRLKLHNERKNKVRQYILENLSAVRDVITNPDGTTYYEFKSGKSIEWNLRDDGVLEVTGVGFTQAQKNAAQQWINTNYPNQDVVIR